MGIYIVNSVTSLGIGLQTFAIFRVCEGSWAQRFTTYSLMEADDKAPWKQIREFERLDRSIEARWNSKHRDIAFRCYTVENSRETLANSPNISATITAVYIFVCVCVCTCRRGVFHASLSTIYYNLRLEIRNV